MSVTRSSQQLNEGESVYNMKKKLTVTGILLLMIAVGVRIRWVNQNVDLPVTKEYRMGEKVAFGNDFTYSPADAAAGYTIQVLDYECMGVDDFIAKYRLTGEESVIKEDKHTRYYILVHVICENTNDVQSEECGIALNSIPLVGINYMSYVNERIFAMVNADMPGVLFSLKPHTSKEMVLTYPLVPASMTDADGFEHGDKWLNLTEYPTRKLILLD